MCPSIDVGAYCLPLCLKMLPLSFILSKSRSHTSIWLCGFWLCSSNAWPTHVEFNWLGIRVVPTYHHCSYTLTEVTEISFYGNVKGRNPTYEEIHSHTSNTKQFSGGSNYNLQRCWCPVSTSVFCGNPHQSLPAYELSALIAAAWTLDLLCWLVVCSNHSAGWSLWRLSQCK